MVTGDRNWRQGRPSAERFVARQGSACSSLLGRLGDAPHVVLIGGEKEAAGSLGIRSQSVVALHEGEDGSGCAAASDRAALAVVRQAAEIARDSGGELREPVESESSKGASP